jgi:membrane-associated phospholipid phosphatase
MAALLAGAWLTQRPLLIEAAALTLLVLPVSTLLKSLFRRLRPETAKALGLHNYSFPSGHSYGTVVAFGLLAYLALSLLAPAVGLIAALWLGLTITGVGLSRVYLGAHYPTDVAAGWLIGTVVLALIIWNLQS